MSKQYSELEERLKELFENDKLGQALSLIKAGMTETSRFDQMLVWLALYAVKQGETKQALAILACRILRDKSYKSLQLMVTALAEYPEAALAVAKEAYRTAPLEQSTQALYFTQLKNSPSEKHRATLEQALSWHLQDIASTTELTHYAPYLLTLGYEQMAVVRQSLDKLMGWVIRPNTASKDANPEPPALHIITNGQKVTRYVPKQRITLHSEADFWQFEISFQNLDLDDLTVELRFEHSEQSKIFGAKQHFRLTNGNTLDASLPVSKPISQKATATKAPHVKATAKAASLAQKNKTDIIDIIIPVYAGREATLACINSALSAQPSNVRRHNLLVINDASPDSELTHALEQLAQDGFIELLVNPVNLGFIGTVNRGLACHPERDVVLLNSDTLVHSDWVDRMAAIAYNPSINEVAPVASVTPFSNNGELMSLLAPSQPAPALTMKQLTQLDRAAHAANIGADTWVVLDAPCGFCMYMKREALTQIGGLDPQLSRGYGEESDWAYRARAHGWQHLGATNTVVAHQGGLSFGEEKRLRVIQNLAIIEQRYPGSSESHRECRRQDPMRISRTRLVRQWLYRNIQKGSWRYPELKVYASTVLAKQALAQQPSIPVFVAGARDQLTLMGAAPIDWRIDYSLVNQRLELEQDLRLMGVQSICASHTALEDRLSYHLPCLVTTHTPVGTEPSKEPSQSVVKSWVDITQGKHGLLIAVVGQESAFNNQKLVTLVNQLERQQSPIYLIASENSMFHRAALNASTRIFHSPFASIDFPERTELITQHLPVDAVLLLDSSRHAVAQAQLFDHHEPAKEKYLPWVVHGESALSDAAPRERIQIASLNDLVSLTNNER